MTDEQIEKLSQYLTFLRHNLDLQYEAGDRDMIDYWWTKIEVIRDISVIFNCREEVFKRANELKED